ncbi:hypothetical protein ABK040_008961 [Willaertia magna]
MQAIVVPNYFSISFPFTDPIKLISYDDSNIVICTENNKIYKSNLAYSKITFNEFKTPESINNVKFMDYKYNHLIIVTELNEFYVQVYEKCYFIKLNFSFSGNIKQFSIVNDSLFIVTKDFSLYTLENFKDFSLDKDLKFTKIEEKLLIKEMSNSRSHLILLDLFGNIYMWGCNENNELGLENHIGESLVSNFTKVELPFKVKQIFANYGCSYIVSEDNELFGTGCNYDGELGVNNVDNIKTFTKIVIEKLSKPITLFQCYPTYSCTSFISDDENNIYLCGGETDLDDYDITLEDEDEPLWKFTKIDLKLNKKYLTVLALKNFTLFIGTDYKINNFKGEENNILGEICFKVLQNEKLVDLQLTIDCNNFKKRKRNEFY